MLKCNNGILYITNTLSLKLIWSLIFASKYTCTQVSFERTSLLSPLCMHLKNTVLQLYRSLGNEVWGKLWPRRLSNWGRDDFITTHGSLVGQNEGPILVASTTYENCGLENSGIIVLSEMKFEVNCDLRGYPIEVGMTLSPLMVHWSGKTKVPY